MTLAERIAHGPSPAPAALVLVCNDRARDGDRCILPAHDDDSFHDAGNGHRWGEHDPFVPEWLKRARVRPNGLAKDFTGSVGPL